MFSDSQRASVRAVFDSAGHSADLQILPLDSGDEVCFVLEQSDLLRLDDMLAMEEHLARILARRVFLLSSVGDATVAFDQVH